MMPKDDWDTFFSEHCSYRGTGVLISGKIYLSCHFGAPSRPTTLCNYLACPRHSSYDEIEELYKKKLSNSIRVKSIW